MYVVQVVQATSRFSTSASSKRHQARQRSLSTDALNSGRDGSSHGVIYMQPSCETSRAAASDALSCQPTRTAVVPWLRQIAVLIRTPEQQQQLQLRNIRVHCSANDSSSSTGTSNVLTASPVGTTANPNSNVSPWGEGPDPLVIHLPGADGTAESSPADPASAGLPPTPTVVSNTNSLMLRGQGSVQRRQPSELGFRPGSSGSKTLPSMLPKGRPSALQHKASPQVPASRPVAESKVSGPLGFLPALQWGNNTYWGSPIGGTLFINPPVENAAGGQLEQQQQQHQQQQQEGKRRRMYWDSPLIGGTLFVNPSLDGCEDQGSGAPSLLGAGEAAAAASAASGAMSLASAAVSGAASNATGCSSSSLQGPPKSSKLPFLPPFQWGGSSRAQWGQYSLMGGTLYINPQAPADLEGSWGSGSNGFGSSSGGGRAGNGGGSSSSSAPGSGAGTKGSSASSGGNSSSSGSGSGSGSIGGVRSRQPGSSYVSAGAAHTQWGAVPAGMRLARLGVGLMAAMAAAALSMYLKAAPSAPNGNSSTAGAGSTVGVHSTAPAAAGSDSAAGTAAAGGAAGVFGAAAGASDTPEGVGFHQWMVQRLQSTLEGFEAEQAMLKTELAMLKSMAGAGSSSKGVLGGIRQWLVTSSSSSSSSDDKGGVRGVFSSIDMPAEAAAAAAAASGGVTGSASLSAADVSARVAEIQEQLESIEVLKAALSAEFAEQQQLLRKAQQQQQPAQDRLAALAVR